VTSAHTGKNPEFKVILFDMGGVLCRLNDPIETFGLQQTHEKFLHHWLLSDSVRDFERGAIDAETFAGKIVLEAGLSYSADEFLQRFDSWPDRLFPGVIELINSIPDRYVRAVLSNTNAVHWNRPEIGCLLEECIENIFLSCDTGLLKPDAPAFEDVVVKLGCQPGEVLFFDDNPLNTRAAEQFGYRSVLIREFNDLGSALEDYGILVNAKHH